MLIWKPWVVEFEIGVFVELFVADNLVKFFHPGAGIFPCNFLLFRSYRNIGRLGSTGYCLLFIIEIKENSKIEEEGE